MPEYNSKDYWDLRYHDETNFFEWYCSYDDVRDYIVEAINKTHSYNLSRVDIDLDILNINDNKDENSTKNDEKKSESEMELEKNKNSNNGGIIHSHLQTRILDFGCGTSLLSYNMARSIPNTFITGYDPSRNCINFMTYHLKNSRIKHVNETINELEHNNININKIDQNDDDINIVTNVKQTNPNESKQEPKKVKKMTNLYYTSKFPTNKSIYDIVIDKGTLDSLLCELNGVDKCRTLINKTIRNVLKKNGIYLVISHNSNRNELLNRSNWSYIKKQFVIKIDTTNNKNKNINDKYHETNEFSQFMDSNVNSILAPMKRKISNQIASITGENNSNLSSRRGNKKTNKNASNIAILANIEGMELTEKEKRELQETEERLRKEELEKEFLLQMNNPNISEIEKRRIKREKFERERKQRKLERERMEKEYLEQKRIAKEMRKKGKNKNKNKLTRKQKKEMKKLNSESNNKVDLSEAAMLNKFHNYFPSNLVSVEPSHEPQCYYHHSSEHMLNITTQKCENDSVSNAINQNKTGDNDEDDDSMFRKVFYVYFFTKLR